MSADRAASALARLLHRARRTGENYNLLLSRFAMERLLFRLSVSPHAGSFVLKGALLFALWYDTPHRPTKDADLLGFGADDADTLRATFCEICAIAADDGVRYDTQSMKIAPIREDKLYGGMRISLLAFVGSARLPVQVDIGFGDAIVPAVEFVTYPTLLVGMDAPRLRAYPVYTVIAEKFHAMVELGIANSRMKDFVDLATIAKSTPLDGKVLIAALRATFARRGTALQETTPIALSQKFAADAAKSMQWRAFLSKAQLPADDLGQIVTVLAALLEPPMRAAARAEPFVSRWEPSAQAWRESGTL